MINDTVRHVTVERDAMREKNFDVINEVDVRDFLNLRLPEDRSLDYKQELNFRNEDITGLLKDISAFANTAGGILIYGVSEERDTDNRPTGIPKEITGCGHDNGDEVKKRIENWLYELIEPRIFGVRVKSIHVDGNMVVLIKIPQSLFKPHALKKEKTFWFRADSRNCQMGVEELRLAFGTGSERTKEIKNFRTQRVMEIAAGETPIPLENKPLKTIIHYFPTFPLSIDLEKPEFDRLWPLFADGCSKQPNYEGKIYIEGPSNLGGAYSYLQLYRDGSIETVSIGLSDATGNGNVIASKDFEEKIIENVKRVISLYASVDIQFPVSILISMVGAQGFKMAWSRPNFLENPRAIIRDTLLLPEVMFESANEPVDRKLKPVFDIIWNASGIGASPYYNINGTRTLSI